MRYISRAQRLNAAYYSGLFISVGCAVAAFALGYPMAAIISALCFAGWAIGALVLQWLFEPALRAWIDREQLDATEAEERRIARRSLRCD